MSSSVNVARKLSKENWVVPISDSSPRTSSFRRVPIKPWEQNIERLQPETGASSAVETYILAWREPSSGNGCLTAGSRRICCRREFIELFDKF